MSGDPERNLGFQRHLFPPALTDIAEISALRDLPVSQRPTNANIASWITDQGRRRPVRVWRDHGEVRINQEVDKAVTEFIDNVIARSDRQSPSQTYTPLDSVWVRDLYNQPDMKAMRDFRDWCIENHTPRSMLLLVDIQSVFGMDPFSDPVHRQLTQRSYGEQNLRRVSDFIKLGLNHGAFAYLTTMVHSGQTSFDRLKQQQKLGLASASGDFYLCPVGSLDTMVHPLLLSSLGFDEAEVLKAEKSILLHNLSKDLGKINSLAGLGPQIPQTTDNVNLRIHLRRIGDALLLLEKPERQLSRDNFEQIVSGECSDIFIGGADIHVCVAEVARNLRYLAGFKPLIWIVADLSMTRPDEFNSARKELENILRSPSNLFIITQEEALNLLQRNQGINLLQVEVAANPIFSMPLQLHIQQYGNT